MTPDADIYQGERRVAFLSRTAEGIRYHREPSVDLDHGMLATTLAAFLSDRTRTTSGSTTSSPLGSDTGFVLMPSEHEFPASASGSRHGSGAWPRSVWK